MTVPDWWAAVLLALAAYRTFRLVGEDKITERPRHRLLYELEFRREGRGTYWQEFITCPWCAGFWIALVWFAAFELWEHATVVAAVPFAISTVVGLIAGVQALVDRFNG